MLDAALEGSTALEGQPAPEDLAGTGGGCDHLQSAADLPLPLPDELICEDCVLEGTTPVHLRMCLDCGKVGCCDSSPGLHATAHFRSTGHPVVRSAEPGESWRWCYADQLLG